MTRRIVRAPEKPREFRVGDEVFAYYPARMLGERYEMHEVARVATTYVELSDESRWKPSGQTLAPGSPGRAGAKIFHRSKELTDGYERDLALLRLRSACAAVIDAIDLGIKPIDSMDLEVLRAASEVLEEVVVPDDDDDTSQ